MDDDVSAPSTVLAPPYISTHNLSSCVAERLLPNDATVFTRHLVTTM